MVKTFDDDHTILAILARYVESTTNHLYVSEMYFVYTESKIEYSFHYMGSSVHLKHCGPNFFMY